MSELNSTSLFHALQALTTEFDRDLPITALLVYLAVSKFGSEGTDQGEIQDALGVSSGGMSRTVQTLGKIHYLKGKSGLDLVFREMDPADNRRRILRLTPRGRRLLQSAVTLVR